MDWKNKFGSVLRYATDLYNIDYVEFSDELGIDPSNFRQWRSGHRFPNRQIIGKLCDALTSKLDEKTDAHKDAELKKLISLLCPELSNTDNDGTIGGFTVAKLMVCFSNGSKRKPKEKSEPTGRQLDRISHPASSGKVQAIVFDFDGTLTHKGITRTTWESIWIGLGYSVDECISLHKKFDNKEISHQEWCDLTCEKFLQMEFASQCFRGHGKKN